MEQSIPEANELHDFIEFLFGGLSGLAYVADVNPQDRTDWNMSFIHYPADASRLETVILAASETRDVYLAPALYTKAHPDKSNIKCSQVVWTEFDGNAQDVDLFTTPSLRVRTSTDNNEHVYWRLNEPVYDVSLLEEINRNITYNHSADSSAWDATQVLRPPLTVNRKPERNEETVRIVSSTSTSYDLDIFRSLPEAPIGPDTSNWQLGALPKAVDVMLKYEFTPDMAKLFAKDSLPNGQRSTGLMNLAYGLAQMGLSDPEIFVLMLNADERWGKFKGRKDQNKRLAHIIAVARNKYPSADDSGEDVPFAFALDFVDFLNTDIEIDWLIEPMFMEQGVMLLVGPSGIGKTQLSLRFMIAMALGKNFLHYIISKPRKLIFLSLEMGFGELKVFLEAMAKTLTAEDMVLLKKNFIIVPHGEKWALNTPVGQEHLIRLVEEFEPDGVFVDSVGSAIQGSLSDDETVIAYLDFIDRIRKKFSIFWWHIHHMRKSSNGGHTPSSQDDVYGNQYLVNRSTSSYGVLRGKQGYLKIRNFKIRLADKEQDYLIQRVDNLDFVEIGKETEETVAIEYKAPEESKGPGVGTGNFDL